MTANGVATAESTTYMNSMLNELGKSGTNRYGAPADRDTIFLLVSDKL